MNLYPKSALLVTASIAMLSTNAHAQWSADSTMHQVVADGLGEQVQPKIVPTDDGGCYISWYSSESGYDVRLQRLDAQGNEMWAHNGVLVADRGFSSTQDYGLDVDSDGHAVLAFRDDRFGGVVITAQRVAPDGSFSWGANGIQLGDSAASLNSPDIAATSDGNAVVGWNSNLNTDLASIDASGMINWETTLSSDIDDTLIVSAMEGSDNGSVIVSWVQYGFFLGPKNLMAQKIDSLGNEAWAQRVAVFDGGSLQFGNFPEFSTDGAGGAVFSWYDTANGLNVFAQHLDSDGTELFGHNGAAASINPRERVAPSAAYDPSSDSVYVSWIELDNNQGNHGVFAQRLDNKGSRMWTDSGTQVSAVDGNESGQINVQIMDDDMVTLWVENTGMFNADVVQAARLDESGSEVWSVDVASDAALRSRLTSTVSSDGFIIGAWQIGDFGDADIETHNLNPDGTLGAAASCPADINGDGDLNFFDVSAFLAAFSSMDPVADFTGDGMYNFFDVSAFLGAFSGGCP
ncbi:MAG: hypothetical protein CMJ25_16660 [Phycisphaerae bacterium]|nr:hypothetical protein [Phycisphaerae bacterium]